jgi:D-glycero-alpha-D-manno-heptose 1-phosphate guanylyltransferase
LPQNEPTLLLNGDTYFDVPLAALALRARQHDAHWCFALFRSSDAARYMGVGLAEDGRITALRQPSAPLANGGVYLFRPSALRGLLHRPGDPFSLEHDLFPQLLTQGQRFAGVEIAGDFIDIGIPYDYHRAGDVLPLDAGREPSTELTHAPAHALAH